MWRFFLSILVVGSSFVGAEEFEVLDLDIISYEALLEADSATLELLDKALHEKGIVGVRGVPGYREKYAQFIQTARAFHALEEEVKLAYQPNRAVGDTLGYEVGKEKFRRPSGEWFIDDLKTSYYALVPDHPTNKWPLEIDLKTPLQDLGGLMSEVGEMVMQKVGLFERCGECQLDPSRVARVLYYRKSESNHNPYWCGGHFDHGMFTALLPSCYFVEGEQVPEPREAGLFVRTSNDLPFKKVVADDLDLMLFQVGEFGQVVTDDKVRATEHRVHKAEGAIERYTLALFFNMLMDTPIYSQSVLTEDARYGAQKGELCTFRHWNAASLARYLVDKNDEK